MRERRTKVAAWICDGWCIDSMALKNEVEKAAEIVNLEHTALVDAPGEEITDDRNTGENAGKEEENAKS